MGMRTAGAAALLVLLAVSSAQARSIALPAPSSLYSGIAPRPGPDILYAAARHGAAAHQHRLLEGAADPRLRRQRLPQGRVPLPGLPLRRPRRARSRDPNDPRTTATRSPSRTGPIRIRPTPPTRTTRPTWSSCASGRCRPSTAFRITLNTMNDPSRSAFYDRARRHARQPRTVPAWRQRRAPPRTSSSRSTAADGRCYMRAAAPAPARALAAVSLDSARAARSRCGAARPSWDPGRPGGADGGRRRPLGRRHQPLPAPAADAPTRHPGGGGERSTPPAFFNVAFRFDEPMPDRSAIPPAPRQNPRLVARPGPGRGARRRRHQPLLRRSRLQQARRERDRRERRARSRARSTASWRATSSPARASTTQSLLPAAAATELHRQLPGAAAALCDLRATQAAAGERLRHDAAAALARRHLQPVPRQPQPVAVRRARERARS